MYKLQSLKCVRAGINRHLKETRGIDIISDPKFTKANEMFCRVSSLTRRKGLAHTKSFPVIQDEDLKKLGAYFQQDLEENSPVDVLKLQKAVQFHLMFHTCRHGKENLHEMTKNTYKIYTDISGKEYVQQFQDEANKNHCEDSTELANEGKIFAKPGKFAKKSSMKETFLSCHQRNTPLGMFSNLPQSFFPGSNICPVNLFKLMTSKLHPDINNLWQQPKKNVKFSDPVWFDKAPIGCNQLSSIMSKLLDDACLSQCYTNHSIRATCITALDEAGFESRHIMAVSSHHSESTIKTYAKKCPESKKREMSETLNEKMEPEPTTSSEKPLDLSTIDLFELDEISDEKLSQFLDETEKVLQKIPGNQLEKTSLEPLQPVLNSVVHNIQHNSMPSQMPQMYFPNSNVTINYYMNKEK